MVAAAGRVGEIDPGACAGVARDRFGGRAMVEGYIHVYEQALARTPLAEREEAQGASAHDTADAVELPAGRDGGSVLTRRTGTLPVLHRGRL
jgi:hypothetical protein